MQKHLNFCLNSRTTYIFFWCFWSIWTLFGRFHHHMGVVHPDKFFLSNGENSVFHFTLWWNFSVLFSLIFKYYTLLYQTRKSTFEALIFRGQFHPLNGLHGTWKKNTCRLVLGAGHLVDFPCKKYRPLTTMMGL